MTSTPPRLRLPGPGSGALRHPPGTLGPLAALEVGDAILGVDDDDATTTYAVVDVRTAPGAAAEPGAEDVVARDPGTRGLRIVVRTGAYRPEDGTYAELRILTARPVP